MSGVSKTPWREWWSFEDDVLYLNHGSFGACPREVLAQQRIWLEALERQPHDFLLRDMPELWNAMRCAAAEFFGADREGLAFVPNATTGVNAVLRSFPFEPGDEIVVTDHEYNAVRNAVDFVAERAGARVIVVPVPFPLESSEEVVDAVLARVTERTRLVVVDHVTSATGLVMPVEAIIEGLAGSGTDVLVDGAHAPGMLDLNLNELGATYYTGNCHKWLCAPRGAAILYVREDRREQVRPTTISHGANMPTDTISRFHNEFDWPGTFDPTAYLAIKTSIDFFADRFPGAWAGLRQRNRETALEARTILCEALGMQPAAPEDMIGSLVSFPLPAKESPVENSLAVVSPLGDRLWKEHRIELPFFWWPSQPERVFRISVQAYNHLDDYRKLAAVLPELLR
ncbi:MAG: aminotransferase class V-fold PLP-dependent enzyme [Myxococcales bacterium]|nr:aminotransferase class V-fold PLP-dependent enzyme [Myxococcales bacterium]